MKLFLPLICYLALTTSAAAINITMRLNTSLTDSPSFDGNRSKLQGLFSYAEAFYEDIFQDSHNITINYWYDDLSGSTLGDHALLAQSGDPVRETIGNIRIDTSTSWFIDPTPGDNSEYTMHPILWRDLSTTELAQYYTYGANVPPTFEVGNVGYANSGSAADGRHDMLSVILHEVGHALGMMTTNESTFAQTSDGDYDFNPAFVFGKSIAAKLANTVDKAHLENNWALMNPSISSDTRALPSHTDLFAMASGHLYANLDVPRREFYGGAFWNTNGNWSGNAIPEANDEAYLRLSTLPHISFSASASAGAIHVETGVHTFAMGAHTLTANGKFAVDEGGSAFITSGVLDAKKQLILGDVASSAAIDGRLSLAAGGRVVVNDASNTALVVGQAGNGILTQTGGVLEVAKDAAFGAIASPSPSKGTYNLTGGDATFSGTVHLGAGGIGEATQSGASRVRIDGDLRLATQAGAEGRYTLSGGDLDVKGAISLGAGTTDFKLLGGTLHVGRFVGNLVNGAASGQGAAVAPGGGPLRAEPIGRTIIDGNFQQHAAGRLAFDVNLAASILAGGPVAGNTYDAIDVNGAATILGGTLSVSLLDTTLPPPGSNGSIPGSNYAFILFEADSAAFTGAFANVTSGGRLTTTDGLGSFQVNYGASSTFPATQIVLSDFRPATAAIPGDFDSDGVVDADDLAAWKTGFGRTTGANPSHGNADEDADVDGNDFLIWQRQLGRTPIADAVAAVPEPSALALACIVGATVASRRRRQVTRE